MTNDFTTTLLVVQTPQEVFDAVNNVRGWWSGDITGSTDKLNDEFDYSYKEFHYSRQRVVEMVPRRRVVWLVTDSSINFVDDKKEWTGTTISFDITEQEGKTLLTFTHHGLAPEVECFGSCSGAWTQLIQQGLHSLITTGKPHMVFLG